MLIAHRGLYDNKKIKENTIKAFDKALQNGFDGFVPCQSCGRLIKKNTSNTKYCKECSKKNDSYNKDEFYENWKRQNGLESLKTQK